uniref:Uncharacterized protein n=1 Tax=Triticum urartu TaxID=4572 RepID=A0A8R7PD39_TRIUA
MAVVLAILQYCSLLLAHCQSRAFHYPIMGFCNASQLNSLMLCLTY